MKAFFVLVLFCLLNQPTWRVGVSALTRREIRKFQSSTDSVSIQRDGKKLILTSNGIPEHAVGNPDKMQPQSYSWTITNEPTPASEPQCLPMGPIGMAINGVPIFSAYTSGCCDAGQEELDLFDTCWGHSDGNGRYHYHIAPLCLFIVRCDVASDIIGVAFDGYPIYGPNDENGVPIERSRLDECNGMTDSNGNYRYHLTTDFPYTLGCFKGVIDHEEVGINRGCKCTTKQDPCVNINGKKRRKRQTSPPAFECCSERPARCEHTLNE